MNVFLPIVLAALALSSPVPDPSDSVSASFAAAVDAAAREAGGAVVGVTAVHIESGRRLSVRGGETFQMASVFKVPVAIAALLVRLFRGELLSRVSTDRILDAMRRCATGDRRLRAGLPKGTEVLDKTGTVRSCSNDAGILTLPDGTHLVLAVFVRGGRDAAARDETIARVARSAWQAFAI